MASLSIGAFLASGLYFGKAASSPLRAQARALFSPAALTPGHAQIEMQCTACHGDRPFNAGVTEKVCIGCHARDDDNKAESTHPKSKFEDPANADRLKMIAADNCITCHKEHQPGANPRVGVTQPKDFCIACHRDVAKDTPSHQGMAFDTCNSAGCHSYHDNRNTYRKLLERNIGKGDPNTRLRPLASLKPTTDMAPEEKNPHGSGTVGKCETCHAAESDSFAMGKHGFRRAAGLPPMSPALSSLSFRPDAPSRSLTCTSCHEANRPNVKHAAVESCLSCHDDQHTRDYLQSKHFVLWKREQAGTAAPGAGVSCATCHMPRVESGEGYITNHNQTGNLRPVIKQGKVCAACHGLQFTLDALAGKHVKSIEMVAAKNGSTAKARNK